MSPVAAMSAFRRAAGVTRFIRAGNASSPIGLRVEHSRLRRSRLRSKSVRGNCGTCNREAVQAPVAQIAEVSEFRGGEVDRLASCQCLETGRPGPSLASRWSFKTDIDKPAL